MGLSWVAEGRPRDIYITAINVHSSHSYLDRLLSRACGDRDIESDWISLEM